MTESFVVFVPSSICQQDSYNEGCDNVYEDVENINKLILGQISRKRKSGLKSKNVYLTHFRMFLLNVSNLLQVLQCLNILVNHFLQIHMLTSTLW